MGAFTVIRTPAFELLAADYAREHPKLEEDLAWLDGRLAEAPELMGDHVPELRRLVLPAFKNAMQGFLPQNRRVRRVAGLLCFAQGGEESVPAVSAPQKGIRKSRRKISVAENGTRICQRVETQARPVSKPWPNARLGEVLAQFTEHIETPEPEAFG